MTFSSSHKYIHVILLLLLNVGGKGLSNLIYIAQVLLLLLLLLIESGQKNVAIEQLECKVFMQHCSSDISGIVI